MRAGLLVAVPLRWESVIFPTDNKDVSPPIIHVQLVRVARRISVYIIYGCQANLIVHFVPPEH